MKVLSMLALLIASNSFAADYTFKCESVHQSDNYYKIHGDITIVYSSNSKAGIFDAFATATKNKQANPIKSITLNYKKGIDGVDIYTAKFPTTGFKTSAFSKIAVVETEKEWSKPFISISQFVTFNNKGNIVSRSSGLGLRQLIPSEGRVVDFEISQCTDQGWEQVSQLFLDAVANSQDNQIGYEF